MKGFMDGIIIYFIFSNIGTIIACIVLILLIVDFVDNGGYASMIEFIKNFDIWSQEHMEDVLLIVCIIVGVISLIIGIWITVAGNTSEARRDKPKQILLFGFPIVSIMSVLPNVYLLMRFISQGAISHSSFFENFDFFDFLFLPFELLMLLGQNLIYFIVLLIILAVGIVVPNIIYYFFASYVMEESTRIPTILSPILDIIAGALSGGVYWGILFILDLIFEIFTLDYIAF